MTENTPQPDPALQDLINLAAASEALGRLVNVPPYFGGREGQELRQLVPLLARKTVVAAKRALRLQPPAVIGAPATVVEPSLPADDLLARVASLPLRPARAVFETAFLARQVVRHKGNLSSAADFCGMERSAFYRKLRGLGIIGTFERLPGRTRHRKRTPR